ncbi:hypothetical protein DMUE_4049 [Dictyocoela muelleri]|nr:hypothetical protein DMUE_4049 [Dictyocoela muelleri]
MSVKAALMEETEDDLRFNDIDIEEEINNYETIYDENLPSIDSIVCDIDESKRPEPLKYFINKMKLLIYKEEKDVVIAFTTFKHLYYESRAKKASKEHIID